MVNKESILLKIEETFQDIFNDKSIKILDTTTAEDIEEWDSFNHINIIMQIEKDFNIKFALGELQELQNVGDMINLILEKTK